MATEAAMFSAAKRVRLAGGVLAALCFIGFVGTGSAVVGVHRGSWVAAVISGCVEFGRDHSLMDEVLRTDAERAGSGLVVGGVYPRGYGGAWRPFRAGNDRFSRVVFPLWQPMVVFGAAAAFAHGVVVGGRRADRGLCPGCGYDVRSIPAGGKCPECGHAREGGRGGAVGSGVIAG